MVQVTVNMDEETFQELSRQKEETGLSMSKLIMLRLKGYRFEKSQ